MKGAVEQGDASVRGGAPWCCIAVHGMVGKKSGWPNYRFVTKTDKDAMIQWSNL